ncbi:hypothetical protein [Kaarinaea lacus]
MIDQIKQFKQALSAKAQDYVLHSTLPTDNAQLWFIGKLNDEEILWHATFQTSASYYSNPPNSEILGMDATAAKSFISVAAAQQGVAKLHAVLAVDTIDEPTIKKGIIMIRNYKRLTVGRHDFGSNL